MQDQLQGADSNAASGRKQSNGLSGLIERRKKASVEVGQVTDVNGCYMGIAPLKDHEEWYAIRTKPKEEDRADLNLRTWQVETFAPKLKTLRTTDFGSKYVNKPLFSSYIFARFNANKQLHDINYTRGVQKVVSFGGSPISIDGEVISFIRGHLDENGFIRLDQELKRGDRVRISSGPFESLVGIFTRKTKDKDRVRILLDAMKYQSHLLIDRELVEKLDEARSSTG
jgi:transcriptional antiterminator RfaH